MAKSFNKICQKEKAFLLLFCQYLWVLAVVSVKPVEPVKETKLVKPAKPTKLIHWLK
jgi:hypothetical protein